jgi:hypothetical protein
VNVEDGFASLFVPATIADGAACDALLKRLEHAKARARIAEVSPDAFDKQTHIEGTRWFWALPEQVLWCLVPPRDGAPGEFRRVVSQNSLWRRMVDRVREFLGKQGRQRERRARHRLQRR